MLIESLFQHGQLPKNANPDHVRQVMAELIARLEGKLEQEYVWAAACTEAVEAGRYGGDRRRKAREKLRRLVAVCAVFLGEDDPLEHLDADPTWSGRGLYYG